jgi:spore coat protein A
VEPLHPEKLARFVDALPIPPVLRPVGLRPDPREARSLAEHYRVVMREARVHVHRDLPATRVWGYEGAMPGPTIETRSGRGVLVEWQNALPNEHFLPIDHTLCGAGAEHPEVRAVVHVHGARAPAESDGHPEDWYRPGQSKTFHYPSRQDAATLWYHDHAMGIERLNQYAGLFGLWLVRDEVEDGLKLPTGAYEIPLLLCDRSFDVRGQLVYPTSEDPRSPWVSELNCDTLLVNGKIFPYADVQPRLYRLRIVNASNSRFYYLALDSGQPFYLIGTEQGLLEAPEAIHRLELAPAERADVLVDFAGAAGRAVVLINDAFQLMQFRVGPGDAKQAALPRSLRPLERLAESAAVVTRTLTLNEYEEPDTHRMLMLLDAKRWSDPVSERPRLGSTEIWRLVNATEDTHPIHLHLVRFLLLDRHAFDADDYAMQGRLNFVGKPVPPQPDEAGWKDTVRAEPGMVTRIIVRFEGYSGRYAWHCHVLEHAANEMMRPFEVVA